LYSIKWINTTTKDEDRAMNIQIGDMIGIRKSFNVIFGIYEGKGKIIYFDKTLKGGVVKEADIGQIAGGLGSPFIDTKEEPLFEPAEIVARAKSMIGVTPVPKFITSSESFASWAKTGCPRSTMKQVGRDMSIGLLNAFLQKPVKEYVDLTREDLLANRPTRDAKFKQDVRYIYNKFNRK